MSSLTLLFILAVDVLDAIIRKSTEAGLSNGTRPEGEWQVVKLHFADTLFFCKANEAQIVFLKTILLCFEEVFGLKINLSKSSSYYIGSEAGKGQSLANLLQCNEGTLPFTYLGLPIHSKKLSKSWEELISKISRRLSTWKCKFLSLAGRAILLNIVLTAN